jgi:hypothetical protein
MDTFAFLKIAALLLTPPASLAAGALVALVLAAFRLRRLALLALVLAVGHVVILSVPLVSDVLMGSLERRPGLSAGAAGPAPQRRR